MVSKKRILEMKQKLERKLATAIAEKQKTDYTGEYVEKTLAIKEQIRLLDELLSQRK